MIKLKMSYENTNEIGSKTVSKVSRDTYPELGVDTYRVIGEFVNDFMKMAGFSNFDKTVVPLFSLTETEYEKVINYIIEMRTKKWKDDV